MGNTMHSSPIPPLPSGNGPVIPQKYDTPRPASRDSIGDVRVLPPTTALSPSAPSPVLTRPQFAAHTAAAGGGDGGGAEMMRQPSGGVETQDGGVKGVMTEFGEGSVPVKRMPPAPPPKDAVMRDA